MKKVFLVFALGLGLVACDDNTSETGTGGSIDSNYTAPEPSASTDHTNVHPDSSMRKDNPEGNSSGQSGSATNSNNTGSAIDDTKGSK